jgi:hypothetical protein
VFLDPRGKGLAIPPAAAPYRLPYGAAAAAAAAAAASWTTASSAVTRTVRSGLQRYPLCSSLAGPSQQLPSTSYHRQELQVHQSNSEGLPDYYMVVGGEGTSSAAGTDDDNSETAADWWACSVM